jgi:transposase
MERGAEFMQKKKRKPHRNYTGEFKQQVVEDMRQNGLSQYEAAKKYEMPKTTLQGWERVYLEEGVMALHKGFKARNTGQGKVSLDKKVERDLIAENQRLRMENDYLKKLNALVQARELREKKRRQSGN